MTTPLATDLAWLAGIWDGEGSVGINRGRKSERGTNGYVIFVQAQVQMTHVPTIERVAALVRGLGCRVISYHWAEKKAHHKDAAGFRISRTGYVLSLADALIPYAVTKLDHWKIVKEFCELRIARQGLGKDGQLQRGGTHDWWVPYSDREIELYERIKVLNRRGRATSIQGGVDPPEQVVQQFLESK